MMYTTEQTRVTFPSPAKLFTPGVTVIIVLLIAGMLLSMFSPGFTSGFLALRAQNLLKPCIGSARGEKSDLWIDGQQFWHQCIQSPFIGHT